MPPVSIYAVDDDPLMNEIITVLLRGEGYHVRTFERGWEAVDALRAVPPRLLILDVKMPDGNGLDVLAALRAERLLRLTRVLMLSGEDDPGVAAATRRGGASGYLVKPFGAGQLIEEIEMLLDIVKDEAPAAAAAAQASSVRDINPVVAGLVQTYGEASVGRLLRTLADELVRLEDEVAPVPAHIEETAHAIKGAAGTLGFTMVSNACSALEEACRKGEKVDAQLRAAMQACAHARREIVDCLQAA
jgi:CheY-like chemotaxis protein